jgi:hypothetical protein
MSGQTVIDNEPVSVQRLGDGRFGAGNELGFKPGQSGNPSGRPKGVTYIGDWLRQLTGDADELLRASKDRTDVRRMGAAKILLKLEEADTSVELIAIARELMDRTEGRAIQRTVKIEAKTVLTAAQLLETFDPGYRANVTTALPLDRHTIGAAAAHGAWDSIQLPSARPSAPPMAD